MATIGDKNRPYHEAERLLKIGRDRDAFDLYLKLASDGDPNCQAFLGWMYSEGIGTPRDSVEALRWFRQAASLGSARGAYHCANFLLAQKNYVEAMPYLRDAARLGFSPAVLRLGLCHLKGSGVEQDVPKGLRLVEDAARLGNWIAKRSLTSLKIKGHFGLPGIAEGIVTLPVVIIAGFISFMIHGYSEKFMG